MQKKKFLLKTASSLCAVGIMVSGGFAYGANLPTNGTVTKGSAHITYSPNKVQIDQSSDKAIIDWHSFFCGGWITLYILINLVPVPQP